jgi:hypothetical protein
MRSAENAHGHEYLAIFSRRTKREKERDVVDSFFR